MKYKFRAECAHDVAQLFDIIRFCTHFEMKPLIADNLPDVVVEFTTIKLSLDDIIDCMKKFIDGHVMVQTVQPLELYTGERIENRLP